MEALDYLFGTGDRTAAGPLDPSVVFLDLRLPKVDGLEVLRRMRACPRTRAIPVTVLTSSDDEPDLISCYELGANSFLRKPVAFGDFCEAVGQAHRYWTKLNRRPPPKGESDRPVKPPS